VLKVLKKHKRAVSARWPHIRKFLNEKTPYLSGVFLFVCGMIKMDNHIL